MNLEDMYTSSAAGFGMATATNTQRAIMRAIEGRPLEDLATDPKVLASFGGPEAIAALPTHPPLEFDLLAGIRTGKSQIAACRALQLSQTVDASGLASGEVPRVSILSLDLDKSDVVLEHLLGAINAKPALQKLLLGPPTGRSVLVRHPSGRAIEIACVAGARAGGSVVSRWSAGCIFDEFCRMQSSVDGTVVNYDDARRAVLGRLLPGATVLSIGSPWAPSGAGYERFNERFGKPDDDHVVVRCHAAAMNPVWWTDDRIERLRRKPGAAYETDVLANFADPSSSCLAQADVQFAVRKDGPAVLPPRPGRLLAAGMDPASRGNAWTLILVAGYSDDDGINHFEVVLAKQWVGSSLHPLSPGQTLREIKLTLEPYNVNCVFQDQHSYDANADLGARVGLTVYLRTTLAGNERDDRPKNPNVVYKNDLYEGLQAAFQTRSISIPDDRQLISDLLSIRRIVTRNGVGYELPASSDGRHADYCPSLALALAIFPGSLERSRAAASYDARARVLASLEVNSGPHFLGAADSLLPEGLPPERRRAVLERIASGDPEPFESTWSRIAKAQEADRAAAQEAARAAKEIVR
jgi:hypothetical protein